MHVGHFICYLLLVAFSVEVVFYHLVSFASCYQHCFLDSCPELDQDRMNQQHVVLECYNRAHSWLGCHLSLPFVFGS